MFIFIRPKAIIRFVQCQSMGELNFFFFCSRLIYHWESLKLFCSGQCLFLRSDASQTSVDWCKTYNRYKAKDLHRMLSSCGVLLEWQFRVVPGSIHKSAYFFSMTFSLFFNINIFKLWLGLGKFKIRVSVYFLLGLYIVLIILSCRSKAKLKFFFVAGQHSTGKV